MDDVVFVATIGIAGTLIGSVVAPLLGEWISRKAAARESVRRETLKVILKISETSYVMRNLDAWSPEWLHLLRKNDHQIGHLKLLLPDGEEDVAAMLYMASEVYMRKGTTPVEASVNSLASSAAIAYLRQWYRGNIKAKGIAQRLVNESAMNRRDLVLGTLRPGGYPIADDELDADQLAERQARVAGAA